VIKNCFGESYLSEKLGKQAVECCIVYGAESRVLRQAPGRLEHSKMFPKNYFETLAEPTMDTNDFFLRPDRVLASFIIDSSLEYPDHDEVEEELVEETEMDSRVKHTIDNMQVVSKQNDIQMRMYMGEDVGPSKTKQRPSDSLKVMEEGGGAGPSPSSNKRPSASAKRLSPPIPEVGPLDNDNEDVTNNNNSSNAASSLFDESNQSKGDESNKSSGSKKKRPEPKGKRRVPKKDVPDTTDVEVI
jgi:hypothetical protein